MNKKKQVDSFRYAFEGVLHVFRTQKHMRFHFYTVVAVLALGLMFKLEVSQMLILLFTISLVLVAEMFNSAVEALVDMITQQYHPLAKFAKDIAAGAVLIATMNAIIVGAILFLRQRSLEDIGRKLNSPPPTGWSTVTLIIGGVLLFITMIIGKVLGGRGAVWHGGLVSGHSAVGFFLAITIIVVSPNLLTAVLAITLAALIAQSRVEAGIHSLQEVTIGAVLGMLIAGLIYVFAWPTPAQ